ncbi:MAG: fructose-bisphosphatase class II [Chloroflexi bacterium]|nr:fructose-bisphosphatase class II [Chloroflexota bacterium]
MLKEEGDAEGALVTLSPETGVDLLMGIGGALQGVLAACAVKALNGPCWPASPPNPPEKKKRRWRPIWISNVFTPAMI